MFVDLGTIRLLWPEVILVAMASWIYVGGTVQRSRAWWSLFSLAAYAAAAFALARYEWAFWNGFQAGDSFRASGPLAVDYLGYVFRWLALLIGVLFTLIASRAASRQLASEFLGTLMMLVVGLMLVARANDLVLMFVSLELISIPTYVLLYLGRRDHATSEATVKYFFLSILSSALLLYGMSFLYGITGTTIIGTSGGMGEVVRQSFHGASGPGAEALALFALVLLLSGLGFKIAAVPFHFYAPDVYQGTTNANAGLLAVAPKIAGIIAIVRLLVVAMPAAAQFAWQLLMVVAMITMTVGNVCALWQQNIRRLMAYSSIAHAGYMLIGLAVGFAAIELGEEDFGGIAATLFYLFVYVLASLGTFAALSYLGGEEREVNSVDELAGLGRTRPMAAAAIGVCMFSLAGIPPLAGFWGKLTLFLGAITTATSAKSADISFWFAVLAVVGAVNAAIAAAYYLRVVGAMYFRAASIPPQARGGGGAWVSMLVCTLLVLLVGALPGSALEASRLAESSALQPAGATARTTMLGESHRLGTPSD